MGMAWHASARLHRRHRDAWRGLDPIGCSQQPSAAEHGAPTGKPPSRKRSTRRPDRSEQVWAAHMEASLRCAVVLCRDSSTHGCDYAVHERELPLVLPAPILPYKQTSRRKKTELRSNVGVQVADRPSLRRGRTGIGIRKQLRCREVKKGQHVNVGSFRYRYSPATGRSSARIVAGRAGPTVERGEEHRGDFVRG
ncbi:hypothetical protein BJ546DRAFT_189926 [Cryomyces antarcticus]